MTLLPFTFAAFGLVYVLGHSRITKRIRELIYGTGDDFFRRWLVIGLECPACLGFHVGWIASVVGLAPFTGGSRVVSVLLVGFYTAGTTLLLAKLARLDASEPIE